jgi:hypothetical protein
VKQTVSMMDSIVGGMKKRLDLKPVHVVHKSFEEKLIYMTKELKSRTRALQKSRD